MEDERIIELYNRRSETAIAETRNKYNGYCTSIAYRVLASFEETEECVSDVYLKVWNVIPPTQPRSLKAFLGRITHNLALNRYRCMTAKRRSVFTEVLEELEIPDLEEPNDVLECKELAAQISVFLRSLPTLKQKIFLLRYYEYESIGEISRKTGLKETRISTELYRMRNKLKSHLEQEGFEL